jgi:hypothetical protein
MTGRADARPVRKAVGHQGRYNAGRLQSPLLLKEGGRRYRKSNTTNRLLYAMFKSGVLI